ncbi:hypothetical protein ACFVWZ_13055 [Streptomyces sp. NPDC058200]|uniref:hypothetical protein n=1 Tax=Streptomyces sp. NPDC058200 TaxID=3346378 RepID=UPI0036E19A31
MRDVRALVRIDPDQGASLFPETEEYMAVAEFTPFGGGGTGGRIGSLPQRSGSNSPCVAVR